MEHPFIVGEQVYLRGLAKSDIDGPWFDWFNDQANTYYMYNGTYPTSVEGHSRFYEQVVCSKDDLVLAVCLKGDDRHVGNIGLHRINWLYRRAELGIIIGDRQVHGRGIGTEAVHLIIQHGFARLNLHKVFLRVEDGNVAARRAFAKAGFVEEGTLRQEICHHGEWHDSIYMGVLAGEFRGAGGSTPSV
jgi:RimJ/RimL family protein N-acetyltransferase